LKGSLFFTLESFLMRYFLSALLGKCFAVLFLLIYTAHTAVAETPLAKLNPLANQTLGGVEMVGFSLAGFAAIAVGVMAFFGRFSWGQFFSLIGGIAVIGSAVMIVSMVTGA
jgi:type IV secretory pathway VirB2 component (pilin)